MKRILRAIRFTVAFGQKSLSPKLGEKIKALPQIIKYGIVKNSGLLLKWLARNREIFFFFLKKVKTNSLNKVVSSILNHRTTLNSTDRYLQLQYLIIHFTNLVP